MGSCRVIVLDEIYSEYPNENFKGEKKKEEGNEPTSSFRSNNLYKVIHGYIISSLLPSKGPVQRKLQTGCSYKHTQSEQVQWNVVAQQHRSC